MRPAALMLKGQHNVLCSRRYYAEFVLHGDPILSVVLMIPSTKTVDKPVGKLLRCVVMRPVQTIYLSDCLINHQ